MGGTEATDSHLGLESSLRSRRRGALGTRSPRPQSFRSGVEGAISGDENGDGGMKTGTQLNGIKLSVKHYPQSTCCEA